MVHGYKIDEEDKGKELGYYNEDFDFPAEIWIYQPIGT